MKKFFYTVLAFLFLLLGVIGIALPIMPTVPFFLAALYFAAASPILKKHLLNNRIFRYYINIYHNPQGISTRTFYLSLAGLYFSLIISGICFRYWWAWLILLTVAVAITWHLLRLKKAKKSRQKN